MRELEAKRVCTWMPALSILHLALTCDLGTAEGPNTDHVGRRDPEEDNDGARMGPGARDLRSPNLRLGAEIWGFCWERCMESVLDPQLYPSRLQGQVL